MSYLLQGSLALSKVLTKNNVEFLILQNTYPRKDSKETAFPVFPPEQDEGVASKAARARSVLCLVI